MLFKKQILRISLIFALLLSLIFCGFTVWNHSSNESTTQNQMEQSFPGNKMEGQQSNGSDGIGQNQVPPTDNQGQDGQTPPSGFGGEDGQISNDSTNSTTDKNQETTEQKGENRPSQGQAPNMNSNGNHNNGGFMQHGMGGNNNNSSYGTSLIIYSIIFFGLAIGAYFILKYKKIKIDPKDQKLIIFSILGTGLFLRIAFGLLVEGYSTDLNFFRTWANSAANSLSNFYSGSRADYPPFYIYILFFVGKIINISSLSAYSTLFIKIPPILADIISAFLLYKLAKKYISSEASTILALFYIFNPAVVINSTLWGQVDSFFTMIILIAVYLMAEKRPILSTLVFTIGVLMKPQGIVYLPILLFEVVRKRDLKLVLKMAGTALITVLVVIIPFSINQSPLWIINLYSSTISEYPYASVNGFNFFSLIGANYIKNSTTWFIFSYHTYGMLFIVLTTLFSWFIYAKRNDNNFAPVAALIQIAGVFTFSVGMHERYLFPAAALAVLAYIYQKDKRFLHLAFGFSITIFVNTYAILCGNSFLMNGVSYSPLLIITSLLNVLLFIYLVKIVWDKRKVMAN
ncbi:glycosyltransferase family 39 protein [Clostridium sp. SHJSY1]|uniref:glycosyltransferase family 39 protein n=1 Tax=Clostridium sp. SHJSY1 TaxID=2942483 RepID=UPI0028761214|nr:glycosyltransferase family 39 protein [Clostridium sp. SHJSY1]MDS0526126.1 glycosyltransferase family 39 protein [Clostridium sp. SHJSY1]